MQVLFTVLIVVQFVLVTFHDLVTIPGWSRGDRVREVVGTRRLWAITLANGLFPGFAALLALQFAQARPPTWALSYWWIYCAVTVGLAAWMWYVPYVFGTDPERSNEYARMYEGTHQLLPARGDHPRPNLLHVLFHVLFVVNLGLALTLRFG